MVVNAYLHVKRNLCKKRICVLAGNDFNATGVSDSLVVIGEERQCILRVKIVTEDEPGRGF